jgi:hypothetical protein
MSQDSNIRQPVAEPCQDQQAEKPSDYDMVDANVSQRWPKLAPVLGDLKATVVAAYQEADSTSRKDYAWHKRATITAALGGMFAVLLAIAQLPPLLPLLDLRPHSIKYWEPVAAFVAFVAVVGGLLARKPKKWLVERERAERCRFLKFSLLISPESWVNDSSSEERKKRQKQFRTRLEEKLGNVDWDFLRDSVARENRALEDTTFRVAGSIDKETLEQLLDYYHEKRLCYQLQYFERQAERRRRWDELTRVLPIGLFFLSIGAALLHFLYDVETFRKLIVEPFLHTFPALTPEVVRVRTETQGEFYSDELDKVALFLLILAACLPVIGAAIRLLRTAHEFGRNTLRFRATSNELKQLADGLQSKADPQTKADLQAKLEITHRIETVLQAERREWLRLMIEAEWFG